MKSYTRLHLAYNDYNWETTANDSPKLKNLPDRNRFLNSQGHEVLYLINSCAQITGMITYNECRKMELLLHDKLPIGTMSQITAFKWLKEQLNK